MPDVYATIEQAAESVQERLADVLELRAADLQHRAMLEDYLDHLPLAAGARVLEIGCGTGAITRTLAARPAVSEVVGLDPGSLFIEQARRRAEGIDGVSFLVGDGRELPFEQDSFDAVICHTVLCHIPGPEQVLVEGMRVTRSGAPWRSSTATTRQRRWRSPTMIHCRHAPMPRLLRSCTTLCSCVACRR